MLSRLFLYPLTRTQYAMWHHRYKTGKYGYLLELIVREYTSLGSGTCEVTLTPVIESMADGQTPRVFKDKIAANKYARKLLAETSLEVVAYDVRRFRVVHMIKDKD